MSVLYAKLLYLLFFLRGNDHFKREKMEIIEQRLKSQHLRRICDFLNITCKKKYIQDCAAKVDPVPSTIRHGIVWTNKQINKVNSMMKKFPFYDITPCYDYKDKIT